MATGKKRSKGETITGPGGTIRAGTQLPPQVAAMVTLGVVFQREGDDGEYDQMSAVVMLQADGDEHLLERLEARQAQLKPSISAFVKALTKALDGEVVRPLPMTTTSHRRVGRA